MELALDTYELTRLFPGTERFGLTPQFQRIAASVPTNMAERHADGLPKPFIKHLRIASGAVAEMETQCLLAMKLDYADKNRIEPILDRVGQIRRMLTSLQASIKRKLGN